MKRKYPLTATEKKRKEANRQRQLKQAERLKKQKRLQKERERKAKKPKLLASNLLVKEIYMINRRIQASGTNISDWQEEMYCERPAASADDLRNAIKEENKLVDKLSKKMDRLFKKVLKEYGKEQQSALYEFIDYPTIYTRGVSFGSMTYKEKQKIHII